MAIGLSTLLLARFLIMEGSKCTKGSNSKIDKNVTCLLCSTVVPYVLPNYLDGSKIEKTEMAMINCVKVIKN